MAWHWQRVQPMEISAACIYGSKCDRSFVRLASPRVPSPPSFPLRTSSFDNRRSCTARRPQRERERERERWGGSRDAPPSPSPRRVLPYVAMPQAVAVTTRDGRTDGLFSSDRTERRGTDVVPASGLNYDYQDYRARTVPSLEDRK